MAWVYYDADHLTLHHRESTLNSDEKGNKSPSRLDYGKLSPTAEPWQSICSMLFLLLSGNQLYF